MRTLLATLFILILNLTFGQIDSTLSQLLLQLPNNTEIAIGTYDK